MNIALCTDENFSIPALVCITSIFENNKDTRCHIYVLTDGLSDGARRKFSQLATIYNQQIDIFTIDKHRFEGLIVNERFPVSMYYRFLLPEMLPKEKMVLYLDCDIIVRGSLKDIYNENLQEKALAAVEAQSSDDIYWYNTLQITAPYFNSGVLLINLDYWREHNVSHSLIKWIADNPDKCVCPDQNALNVVLQGKVNYLSYRYNFQEKWLTALENSKIHFSKWKKINEEAERIVVMHYCEAEKPWFIESKHPYRKEFDYYATLHSFIGYTPIIRYGKVYQLASIVDKIGLKFRYYAEKWQKMLIKKVRVSK